MTSAARSVYLFGIYLLVTGGVLITSPNTLLTMLQLPPTTEPWAHLLGLVVMALGMYYVACARANLALFLRATVWIRLFAFVSFGMMGVLQIIPPIIGVFGLIDAAGALWTHLAIKQTSAVGEPLPS